MTAATAVACPALVLAALVVKALLIDSFLDGGAHPVQRTPVTATLAVAAFLALPLPWIAPRARVPLVLLVNAALTTLLLGDRIHYRFFGDVLSVAEFVHSAQVSSVWWAIVAKTPVSDAWYFVDVFAIAGVWLVWLRHALPAWESTRARAAAMAGLALVAAIASSAPIRLITHDPEEVFQYSTSRREVAAALGLLPYHVFNIGSYVFYPVTGRLTVTASERERVRRYFADGPAPGRTPSALFGAARNRNVLFVMAESLQDFPIDLTIDGQRVTPALSQFARESIRFTNFFDQTHLGTTADAEFASLQSLLPLPDAVVATHYPANHFFGLPAILAERGYTTVSANVMTGDFWNMRQMHRNLGFERSDFRDTFPERPVIGMGLSDDEFFDQMSGRLAAMPEPFMAYLITLTNHFPYTLPPERQRLKLGRLDGTMVGNYLQSVHEFDRAFGTFVEHLRRSGVLERSLVVLYGDHRAFWDEQPELLRLLGLSLSDPFHRWQLDRRLALMMRLPGQHAAGSRRDAAGHVDIAPTVLGLLGDSPAGPPMLGRDLLGSDAPFVSFRDGTFISGSRIALGGSHDASAGCYDIHDGVQVSCEPLEDARLAHREQIEISDLVILGNLARDLHRQHAPGP